MFHASPSMKHDPTTGAPPPRRHWIPKATHGAALLLGILAWQVLADKQVPDDVTPAEAAQRIRGRNDARQAAAWVDASLAGMRLENAKEREDDKPATMEEFLMERRKDAEKWWRERNDEIDQIIAKARTMRGLADPAAALRESQRTDGGHEDELAIFQHWLDTDPEAALTELGRNWDLLERDYIPALLERKFGIDWMSRKIADEGTPYRLRKVLAQEYGTQLAQGKGLADLLECYNSIPDPRLKIQTAWHFTFEWPLDEPQVVARFLSGEAPKELRDVLLQEWTKLPNAETSWETTWMKELHERLELDAFVYSGSYGGCGMGGMDLDKSLKLSQARASMTLDEVVRDCIKEGKSPEDAEDEAVRSKMHDALNDGPDLIEMFGEGQMTRDELLVELRRKIPGSDAHADALERAAWSKTAWVAEPQEVARWAAELSLRKNMDELLTQTFSSGSIYGDPRIPLPTRPLQNRHPRDEGRSPAPTYPGSCGLGVDALAGGFSRHG